MAWDQGLNAFFEAEDSASALEALRQISLQPIEKVREIREVGVEGELATGGPLEGAGDPLAGRPPHGKDNEESAVEAAEVPGYDARPGASASPEGSGVRFISTGDLPFPTLLRIWNDSKKVKEISRRYAAGGPHRSGERADARTSPTSSLSAPRGASGSGWRRPSTSTRPSTSSCRRRSER